MAVGAAVGEVTPVVEAAKGVTAVEAAAVAAGWVAVGWVAVAVAVEEMAWCKAQIRCLNMGTLSLNIPARRTSTWRMTKEPSLTQSTHPTRWMGHPSRSRCHTSK